MMKLLQEHKGHQDPPLDSCDFGGKVGCSMEAINNVMFVNG